MATDPEDLIDRIDEAEVIDEIPDGAGGTVRVGVLESAVLIGVTDPPAILTAGLRERFQRAFMEAERRAEASEAAVTTAGGDETDD